MINLLPTEYKKRIAFEYRWRVIAITCMMVTVLALIASMFLVPSYLLVLTKANAAAADLANAEKALNTGGGKDVQVRATALAAELKILSGHSGGPSIAGIMAEISTLHVPGVVITSMRLDGGSPEKITLTGQAVDRQSLLLFNEALKQHSDFSNVTLPIDQLVKSENLSYQITLTYNP